MAKIIESSSVWNFPDLLKKTARDLNDDYSKYRDPEEVISEKIVNFLNKLPNLDLDKIINNFWGK